jgi:hypothetical protein
VVGQQEVWCERVVELMCVRGGGGVNGRAGGGAWGRSWLAQHQAAAEQRTVCRYGAGAADSRQVELGTTGSRQGELGTTGSRQGELGTTGSRQVELGTTGSILRKHQRHSCDARLAGEPGAASQHMAGLCALTSCASLSFWLCARCICLDSSGRAQSNSRLVGSCWTAGAAAAAGAGAAPGPLPGILPRPPAGRTA